jgi:hypothetical protein
VVALGRGRVAPRRRWPGGARRKAFLGGMGEIERVAAGACGGETGLLAAATRGEGRDAAVVCSAWPPSQEETVLGLVPGAWARYVGYPSPL